MSLPSVPRRCPSCRPTVHFAAGEKGRKAFYKHVRCHHKHQNMEHLRHQERFARELVSVPICLLSMFVIFEYVQGIFSCESQSRVCLEQYTDLSLDCSMNSSLDSALSFRLMHLFCVRITEPQSLFHLLRQGNAQGGEEKIVALFIQNFTTVDPCFFISASKCAWSTVFVTAGNYSMR